MFSRTSTASRTVDDVAQAEPLLHNNAPGTRNAEVVARQVAQDAVLAQEIASAESDLYRNYKVAYGQPIYEDYSPPQSSAARNCQPYGAASLPPQPPPSQYPPSQYPPSQYPDEPRVVYYGTWRPPSDPVVVYRNEEADLWIFIVCISLWLIFLFFLILIVEYDTDDDY